jgi:glycosyltransferase involved in cell wall biosynthesis
LSLRIGVDGRYLRDDWPGISRFLFELLRAADHAADGAEILLLHDPRVLRTRSDPRSLVRPGLSLVDAPIRPLSPGEQLALPRLLSRLGLDAFFTPYAFTSLACPCPRVVAVHDVTALHPRHGLRPTLRRLLAAAALRSIARRAAVVLTPSHAARAAVIARLGLAPERVSVCGAAAAPRFRPQPPDAVAAVRAALDLPARFVLHVASAQRHKNLDGLLRAWALRPADEVALVLAGAARAADLDTRVRTAGAPNVRVLGPVDDAHLPALYAAAEVFVLPSLDEGFGLPALEAMACGTLVACSGLGALPEVTGGAATLFDPRDAATLLRALDGLLGASDERARRSRAGLARARAHAWHDVAARVFDACRAVARTAPARARAGRAPSARAAFERTVRSA